jgi:hypothetical protein
MKPMPGDRLHALIKPHCAGQSPWKHTEAKNESISQDHSSMQTDQPVVDLTSVFADWFAFGSIIHVQLNDSAPMSQAVLDRASAGFGRKLVASQVAVVSTAAHRHDGGL